MTCAETRRQLPEPEPALVAQVEEHLAVCPPCRGEQEALREVDRRIEQLGQHRLRLADKVLDAALSGDMLPLDRATPLAINRMRSALWLGAALFAVLCLFLMLWSFFRLR